MHIYSPTHPLFPHPPPRLHFSLRLLAPLDIHKLDHTHKHPLSTIKLLQLHAKTVRFPAKGVRGSGWARHVGAN